MRRASISTWSCLRARPVPWERAWLRLSKTNCPRDWPAFGIKSDGRTSPRFPFDVLSVFERDVPELCQNAERSSKNLQPSPDNAKKFQFFSTSNWILKLFIAYDDVYFYSCLLTELVHLLYINLEKKINRTLALVYSVFTQNYQIEVVFSVIDGTETGKRGIKMKGEGMGTQFSNKYVNTLFNFGGKYSFCVSSVFLCFCRERTSAIDY